MVEPISVRFGSRIRTLRLQRGWRQIDLATRAGLTRQLVSLIELGSREINLDTIKKLADAFEMPTHELFEWDTERIN